ncbi:MULTISPECIES: glycosyltransferase [unclassified Micromonospora]|uniref:glycosyltransferase n=1 Tax=unclassified Micromonospora TaxID=2617518 RepID=UPI001B35998E|nr:MULTISPECIES: glycosyltransferase [unclassified Micromonospora]MBQ1041049.1 glycosyltransferase [Micromonospora sp. C72]MBQ1055150.1 glycosyltransferase [Micromonospora sp. C32]
MRHLLVTSVHRISTGQSGEACHLRQLATAIQAGGDRVTVLDGPMDPGTPLADPAALGSLGRRLDELIGRDRPDAALLWGHLGEETPLARSLRAAGVPLVLEHPAADLPPVPETVRLADRVVVPSRFAQRLFATQTGLDAQPIEPLLRPCTCPPDASGDRSAGRRRAGPYRLTFINPEPAKGLGVVLRLVRASAQAGLPFRFRFVEGRWTAADLARFGVVPGDPPGLEIAGYRTDVCSWYADTDLLLVPSLWRESFGMVAREAAIHGIPVVATRVGGLPEAVGDGGICLDPPEWEDGYQVRMTGPEIRAWLEAIVAGLRRGRRPRPGLLSHTAADSLRSYRRVLGLGPA